MDVFAPDLVEGPVRIDRNRIVDNQEEEGGKRNNALHVLDESVFVAIGTDIRVNPGHSFMVKPISKALPLVPSGRLEP